MHSERAPFSEVLKTLSARASATLRFHSRRFSPTGLIIESRDRSIRRIPIRYREGEVFEALLSPFGFCAMTHAVAGK
jgi:hypothetical protein